LSNFGDIAVPARASRPAELHRGHESAQRLLGRILVEAVVEEGLPDASIDQGAERAPPGRRVAERSDGGIDEGVE